MTGYSESRPHHIPWNPPKPGFHTTSAGMFCTLCKDSYHALTYLHQPAISALITTLTSTVTSPCPHDVQSQPFIYAYREFPGCYSCYHICTICRDPHKLSDCWRPQTDSKYRGTTRPT